MMQPFSFYSLAENRRLHRDCLRAFQGRRSIIKLAWLAKTIPIPERRTSPGIPVPARPDDFSIPRAP